MGLLIFGTIRIRNLKFNYCEFLNQIQNPTARNNKPTMGALINMMDVVSIMKGVLWLIAPLVSTFAKL